MLSDLGQSFLVALCVFVICIIVFPPYYGIIDDIHMTMIVSGTSVCPQPDCHILFPNILTGKLLSWLYTKENRFPWYGTALYLSNLFSFTLILAVFKWERASKVRNCLLFAFTLVSLLAVCTHLTFTSTAIFLAASASLALISVFENERLTQSGRYTVMAVSLVSIVVAALIRADSAKLIIGMFAVLITCRFALTGASKKLAAGLALSVLLFGIVQSIDFADQSYYESKPGWSSFPRYNNVINKICDFKRLSYTPRTKNLFTGVGWNENDLNLFSAYEFGIDPVLFSCEKAERLLSCFPNYRSDLSLPMLAANLHKYVCNRIALPSLLLAIVSGFIVSGRLSQARHLLLVLATLTITTALLCLMKLENQITLPLFAWLALCSVYYGNDRQIADWLAGTRKNSPAKLSILFALTAATLLGASLNYRQLCLEAMQGREQLKLSLSALRSLNGSLYIIPSMVPLKLISPFENPRTYFSSMRILIPCFTSTPLINYSVSAEVQKSTRLPLLEPGVFWCTTDSPHRFVDYFKDHHGLRVEFEQCFANKQLCAYRAVPIRPQDSN